MSRGASAIHTNRRPIGRYSDEAAPGILFHPTSPIHHGLVGPHVYEWKGVFEYLPKGCKNQIVTAGRLLAVLDMRPSTTIKGAALLTAPSTSTLLQGPYLIPNYRNEDHKQAQTPADTTVGL